jgi:hypothetical protein
MSTQITKKAAMLVLVIGLTVSWATAQKNTGGAVPVGTYNGVQSEAGTCLVIVETCYGNTFVLASHGEWESHHLTVSLNYSQEQFVPHTFVVAGGSWSMVVIREGQYAGTLFGEVASGDVSFETVGNGDPVSKRARLVLAANGGSGIFDKQGFARIGGVFDMTTDLRSQETTGIASFTF